VKGTPRARYSVARQPNVSSAGSGVASRVSIPVTRAIVRAIVNGHLAGVPCHPMKGFYIAIPESIPGVPDNLLNPRATWKDPAAYDACAKALIQKFIDNFRQFKVSDAIRTAGPTIE